MRIGALPSQKAKPFAGTWAGDMIHQIQQGKRCRYCQANAKQRLWLWGSWSGSPIKYQKLIEDDWGDVHTMKICTYRFGFCATRSSTTRCTGRAAHTTWHCFIPDSPWHIYWHNYQFVLNIASIWMSPCYWREIPSKWLCGTPRLCPRCPVFACNTYGEKHKDTSQLGNACECRKTLLLKMCGQGLTGIIWPLPSIHWSPAWTIQETSLAVSSKAQEKNFGQEES